MLRLVLEEDVRGALMPGVRAFTRKQACEIDIVAATGVGLGNTPDPEILEWAAQNGRVVVTLEVSTMIGFARDRVSATRPMPGLLVLRKGIGS